VFSKHGTPHVKISVWQKTTKMVSTWTTAAFLRENVEILILGFIEVLIKVIKTQINKK
jgi:hypothetical protein